jgi:hypothetical protein
MDLAAETKLALGYWCLEVIFYLSGLYYAFVLTRSSPGKETKVFFRIMLGLLFLSLLEAVLTLGSIYMFFGPGGYGSGTEDWLIPLVQTAIDALSNVVLVAAAVSWLRWVLQQRKGAKRSR